MLQRGRTFQHKYLRSPHNIYATFIVTTLSVFGLLVPSLTIQVISIILIHVAIEIFLTLIAELQGVITTPYCFAFLGPTSQLVRKIITIVISLSGPPAYNVFPRLPYIISGLLCTVFTLGFILFTEIEKKRNRKIIVNLISITEEIDKQEASELSRSYRRMTLASMECMARMGSVILKTLDDDLDKDEGGDSGLRKECYKNEPALVG